MVGESGRQGWTTETDYLDGQRLDENMFKDLINKKDCKVLVFEDGNELVACVNVEKDGDAVYIGMVSVNPLKQGGGIGSFVLKSAEEYGKTTWNVRIAKMSVISKRKALIEFYERKGYKNTGKTEPFPYGDERFGIPKQNDLEFALFSKEI